MSSIKTGNVTNSVIIGGSLTNSSVNINTENSAKLFTELRIAIQSMADSEKNKLLSSVSELEASRGTEHFTIKYKSFMQFAANHMTILAPFLPALSSLI